MDPEAKRPDRAREVETALQLAAWYRSWAEVAGTEEEKAQRLAMAHSLQLKARRLAEPPEC